MDYVTFGQFIVDDVYFPGKAPVFNQPGGAVYTLAGMRYWTESAGICSGVGRDFKTTHSQWFHENKLDTRGCCVRAEKTCHSAIRYFDDGEREELRLPGTPTIDAMCPDIKDMPKDYLGCKGFYFFKDCEKSFWEMIDNYLKAYSPVSVWEILGAAAVKDNTEIISSLLKKVTIFSINLTEGKNLCQIKEPQEIVKKLLHLGAENILFRMGEKGALVADKNGIWHIPAYPVKVVDVTGGGNASTGGFLTGFTQSGGDIVSAGKCAAVSASFMIEQYGVPAKIGEKEMAEAKRRYDLIEAVKIGGVL